MTGRRLATPPPGVRLCWLEDLPMPGARNIVVQMTEGRFHGFVVRQLGQIRGYVDRCPHAGLPLAQRLDDYLTPDGELITCSWHGALFSTDEGLCIGGPCVGQSLAKWPVIVEDGWIVTA